MLRGVFNPPRGFFLVARKDWGFGELKLRSIACLSVIVGTYGSPGCPPDC